MKKSPVSDAPHMVLSNENGHLFLTGDGNKCHEQHLGQEQIDPFVVRSWVNQINAMAKAAHDRETLFCFLPAPDKQSVYWETLSDQQDVRNVSQIISKLNPRIYHDPLANLIECDKPGEYDLYSKVDSHWCSIGAILALDGIFKKWNITYDVSALISSCEDYTFEGDLGIKTQPRTSGTARNLSVPLWKNKLLYDNSVPDNGRIRLFSNKTAPIREAIILLGDSFSYRLAEILAQAFESVFHFHGQSIDRKLLNLIQPKYFLFEQTERFFIREPKYGIDTSFFRILEEKVETKIDIQSFLSNSRIIPTNNLTPDIHQALIIDLSENHIQRLGLHQERYSPKSLEAFVRTMKLTY